MSITSRVLKGRQTTKYNVFVAQLMPSQCCYKLASPSPYTCLAKLNSIPMYMRSKI